MTLYQIEDDALRPLDRTGFQREGLLERNDLQRLLRDQINILGADLFVLTEEFGDWQESRRRIDLLCLDREANLVVVELKRTKRGGHSELQALRYAAMVAEMTFEQAAHAHARYLSTREQAPPHSAEAALLEFLEWEEADEDAFNQDVRIILASQDFSAELTGTVLWLLERGLDITCTRLSPYRQPDGPLILDVQQIIPLPEAADYQIRVREKRQIERESRTRQTRQRFDLSIGEQSWTSLSKRDTAQHLCRALTAAGMSPRSIADAVEWRPIDNIFLSANGTLNETEFRAAVAGTRNTRQNPANPRQWFCLKDELIHSDGRTWAVAKRWGKRAQEAFERIIEAAEHSGLATGKIELHVSA